MNAVTEAVSSAMSVDVNIMKILISFLLACFPAYIWGYIYYTKQPEPRRLVALTFSAGIVSVIPILLYKFSWNFFPSLEIFLATDKLSHITISLLSLVTIPLSVIMAFLFVGLIEEYMKHLAVKFIDNDKFMTIDDAIEYSIIASLGFSFVENVMYFYFIWVGQGAEPFFMAFIFRSIFSTFAHILFSGMYGYFYGVAHFSSPIFQEEIRSKRMWFTRLLHKLTGVRSEKLFHREKVIEGLVVAIALHAVFDVFLEVGWTYVILPYLVIGYLVLDYLFERKQDHINYGKLLEQRTSDKVN
ncbi:MAG: PrsW family glutamic-type intramembrane protease [Candidatus Peregrinibacteria bacterium]|nr:PrsW family glutamic-type intramembrane protease [Candidatus Peregrinibacteria bacterium]MDZ4244426.1 PrsW family glutamic-type intramembrane protease [Candidatus Gracilibacteria bacterium]